MSWTHLCLIALEAPSPGRYPSTSPPCSWGDFVSQFSPGCSCPLELGHLFGSCQTFQLPMAGLGCTSLGAARFFSNVATIFSSLCGMSASVSRTTVKSAGSLCRLPKQIWRPFGVSGKPCMRFELISEPNGKPLKFPQYLNVGFSLGVSHRHQNSEKHVSWNISVGMRWNQQKRFTFETELPIQKWSFRRHSNVHQYLTGLEGVLPPGHDWPPGRCALWCSSTWTLSRWNNLWRCTPSGRRLGTAPWRGAPWSAHRNPAALSRWGARCLEPTCKYRSGRKERARGDYRI